MKQYKGRGNAIIEKSVKEGLSEKLIFEQRHEGGLEMGFWKYLWKRIPGRGNSE